MLKLEVIRNPQYENDPHGEHEIDGQHFVVSADEPLRIEVSATAKGCIIMHAYRGIKIDEEQHPDLVFDGTIGWYENEDIVKETGS